MNACNSTGRAAHPAGDHVSPGRLNAADAAMHRELCRIWRDIDDDPTVSAVILTGAGRAFSAGGDFDLVEAIIGDFATRARVWKEARDLVYNVIDCGKPIVAPCAARLSAPGWWPGCWPTFPLPPATPSSSMATRGSVSPPATTPPSSGRCSCGLAKAKYYLLTLRAAHRRGGRAHRARLARVDDAGLDAKALEVASRLARGAPSAIRWTKYALNNWLRMAGPAFDTSLALEFLGFTSPEAREGLAAHREKRPPRFDPDCPV